MKQKTTFKMFLALVLMAFCGNGAWAQTTVTDVLTAEKLGLGGSYSAFETTASANLKASYRGAGMKGAEATIQIKSKKNSSNTYKGYTGIISTTSPGKVKSVKVTWKSKTNDGTKVNVYVSNAPFASLDDLFKSGTDALTSIGSITSPNQEFPIEGDYQYVGLRSGGGAIYLKDVSVTWETNGKGSWPISFGEIDEYNHALGQTFTAPTLTNTKNATVVYTSSNPEVATVAEDGKVAVKAVGNTTISATAAGNEQYNETVTSYTLNVLGVVENVKALLDKKDENHAYFVNSPVVVIEQHGANMWIKDASVYTQVYGQVGQQYKSGDVIPAGFIGTYGEHNGFAQIVDPKEFKASTGKETLTPEVKTLEALQATDFNRYVEIKEVLLQDNNSKMMDGTAVVRIDDKLQVAKPENVALRYDVEGLVSGYVDSKTNEFVTKIIPMSYQTIEPAKQEQTISFPEAVYNLGLGETFNAPTVTGKTTVTYTSSNTNVATVNATTGEVKILKAGSTTIVAKAVSSAEYYGMLASYDLNVESLGAALPFRFNGNGTELAQCVEFVSTTGIENYSTDNARLKFASANDELTLKLKEAPGTLSYNLKLNKTNKGILKKFDVLTSVDGVNFDPFKSYSQADFGEAEEIYVSHVPLAENVRYIRWIYSERDGHNIGLGAIYVTKKGEATAMPIVVGEEGYATLYATDAFVMPEGLVGNTVKVEGNKVVLTPSYQVGDYVSAKTPLLLSGNAKTYQAVKTGCDGKAVQANDLKGALTNDVITAPANTKFYIFANDPANGLGFYYQGATGDGSSVQNLAGKAYLSVTATPDQPAAVQGYRLDGGDLTGIEAIEAANGNAAIYTLSGVRVSAEKGNLPKGLYIINGKKILVK